MAIFQGQPGLAAIRNDQPSCPHCDCCPHQYHWPIFTFYKAKCLPSLSSNCFLFLPQIPTFKFF